MLKRTQSYPPFQSVTFLLSFILSLCCLTLFHSPATAKAAVSANTVLAPGDSVRLHFKRHPFLEKMTGEYTIDPRGHISIEGLGAVQAAGTSVSTLQERIQKALRSITSIDSAPEVSLLQQNRFILMGQGVRYPGWYKVPLRPSLEVLTNIASGLKPGTSLEHAAIIRKHKGKTKKLSFAKALPLQSFDHLTLTSTSDSAIVDNGDLLYVVIPKEITGEFSPTEKNYFKEKVEIDRHGFIFLPSQGNIKVSGFTTAKISELLTNNLPKYLSKSDKASVNLIEKRHYIQILGHVAMPGWYNIPESANIQAILSQAGGTIAGANLSKVTISRKANGEAKQLLANIQYYLSTGDNRMLPVLHENDTVFVPLTPSLESEGEAGMAQAIHGSPKIRIFGAVNTPGIYPALASMNLLDLLITAQGETADADLTKIKIMRANGDKELFNMQALLDSNSSGEKTTFPQIRGGDIVHIARQEPETSPVDLQTGQPVAQSITMSGPGSNGRGMQPFIEAMTPLQAIAQAGGVTAFADTNDIIIIRRVNGKQENIPYNYDKALKGEEPDVDFLLQAGDMIYIP